MSSAVCHPGLMTDRYHLLLALDSRPAMHGWWNAEPTARRQYGVWIGERGRPGARITLTDTVDGTTLAVWPDEE